MTRSWPCWSSRWRSVSCDGAPAAEPRLAEAPAELAHVLEAAVASLAAKVYVEQTLALQDERR